MASASNLIKDALKRINSYQSGEQLSAVDADGCLTVLNDLLDSWSIQKNLVFASTENILTLQSGKAQYRIGNPINTSLGLANIVGTLTLASPTITATTTPSGLIAGATLTSVSGAIPAGTTVLSSTPTTITMSANATFTPTTPDVISYTLPGDFVIPRPNRITHGFTRVNQLDFTIEVTMSQSRFLEILYKAQPGPWPTVAWYNPQDPYGLINFYQTPGNNGELHLFTDTILSNLTLNQTFILPSGYARAIKWCLAKEICAEYGYPITDAVRENAAESLAAIKALNAEPATKSRYDGMLTSNGRESASWIFTGGYGA